MDNQKKEFRLRQEDFNYIVEISSNLSVITQIVDGKPKKLTTQERVDRFWKRIAGRYGFDPDTVETNLPGKDATWFIAVECPT